MLDIMQHEDIYETARDYLCVRCVVSHRMTLKTAREAFKVLSDLLFEKPPEGGAERLTSFEQDAGLIRSAFKQVYQIDLFRDKLTWFEFTEYMQNLPEGCKYLEVIGIRARPIPAPNKYNQAEREWIIKAKQTFAIHLTDAEAARKYENDVGKIFVGLMSMIPKEVNTDGE